ncbi:hypothetical protein TWF718_009829 [Orbilia javanica]|uniref:Uncharacterized protein n=1 Tax=Orbilia javanica TaxID=47235 RepID=A0AAN8MUA4_9PEZI
MAGSSRFSLLVVALIALVSFVTARTVITSETCTTRYCNYPPKKVIRVTKPICKTTRYTVTRWKTVSIATSTRTISETVTVMSQRYTTIWRTSTVTTLATVWIGTTTHTRTVHVTTTSTNATVTLPLTTFTITTPSVSLPPPPGFTAVADDPDNKERLENPPNDPPWWESGRHRRNAEPEPEPATAKRYASAVTCTQTLLTKTGTSDLWKTTTKASKTTTKYVGVTKATSFLPRITLTSTTTKYIFTGTTSKYKVAFFSTIFTRTLTSYTDTTTYLSTTTTDSPAPTYYEACGPNNRSPGPHFNSLWTSELFGPGAGEVVQQIPTNGTSYDCCVACHTYSGVGTCIGNVWHAKTWWGELPCQGADCPEYTARCDLVIAQPDAETQCRRHQFSFTMTFNTMLIIVSNGPTCNRWMFWGFF